MTGPLSWSPRDDEFCQGVSLTVVDIDALAEVVALVLVQEYELAQAFVSGASGGAATAGLTSDEVEDIIKRRLHPPDRYHRDGLLFQLIMWLGSQLDLGDEDVAGMPHVQAAAKGQDSLIIHRSGGPVQALSICEDKATENPRTVIREEVWPEFEAYEAGGRVDELRSRVIEILGTSGIPRAEALALVRKISWERSRRYRARVTVEPTLTSLRLRTLFKGFDDTVAGDNERRRGETLTLPNLRAWMDDFAGRVENALRTLNLQD